MRREEGRRSDLVDVDCIRHAMTDNAILVSAHEDAPKVWVPLSQCEVLPKGPKIATLTMPQWLAEEKGLV